MRATVLLITTLLLIALAVGASAAPQGDLPWRQGEVTPAGWRVEAVVEHAEFVRFRLRRGEHETTVEVVAHSGPAGEWTSRNHRLQPAPGVEADEQVMRTLLAELRAWDASAPTAKVAAAGQGGGLRAFDHLDLLLAGANLLAVLLVLLLVLGPLRRQPALAAWTGLAGAGAAAAWWWLLVRWQVGDIPLAWITVLHEGPTAQNIEFLYGRNRHTGPNHTLLVWLFAGGDSVGLRDMVRLNLALSAANAMMLLALGRALMGRIWPALLLTALFVGNAAALRAAGSELAAPLTGTLLLLTAAALLALGESPTGSADSAERNGEPARAPRWRWWITVATVALLTGLLALSRTEMAGFGLMALAVGVAHRWPGDGWLRATAWWSGLRSLGWPSRLGLLLLLAATLPAMWLDGRVGWLIAGMHPLNPSILSAPLLLTTLLPLGAVVLVLLGFAHSLRRCAASAGLGLAVLILYRVYFCASHRVFYEMLRYGAALLPAFCLLAMVGWRELEALAHARAWPPRWRHLALLILAMGMVVPPLPGAADLLWDRRPHALAEAGLSANQQLEARFMLAATEAHPDCVIATRATAEIERVDAPQGYEWWLFGGPLRAPLRRSTADVSLQDWLQERLPDAPCVLFYRGLDCHLLAATDCEAAIAGKARVSGQQQPSRPYSDPFEYGAVKEQVELALFALR